MAPSRRRTPNRKLDDLPGLFDAVEINLNKPYSPEEIVVEHRKNQITPLTPIRGDMDIDPVNLCRYRELRFISFGSGSSGNCSYLGIPGEGGLLIDAGIDEDKVTQALNANCIQYSEILGIILTHDHSDHVRGAYALLRHNRHMSLYCTPRCLNGLLRRHNVSRRIKDYHKPIFKEFEFLVGPFVITPFETSHDGTDNVGFSIEVSSHRFVVATDMGYITERADYYISQADFLMIEANYDAQMLAEGPYPEYLKARIRGDRGHLDNAVTAAYLAGIVTPRLKDVYLCHLSQDNNRPETALAAVREALAAKGLTVGDGSGSPESVSADIRLSALPRFDCSPLYVHRLKRE